MLKYPITYTDYEGQTLTEDFYFNLSPTELMKMELGTTGGLKASLEKIIAARDIPSIMEVFEKIILTAYGVKTADGKGFSKVDPKTGVKYADIFKETAAYDVLFMELATDDKKAANFINNVIPASVAEEAKKAEKANHPAVK